jgi:parallel beta-helix repeat protein
VKLASSTLSGNNCTGNGGAIDVQTSGTLTVSQCTVSGNTGFLGGGISVDSGTLTLQNSIVAGNTASTAADINLAGGATLVRSGASVIGDDTTVAGIYPPGAPNANGDYAGAAGNLVNALLAPIGNYGGPTLTMALEPGSPALNHATVLAPPITSDQRGFPIIGTPDIGAYEAGTTTNYNAWIYENLPATATAAQHASGADYDGDGVTNYYEWLALTNPADPTSFLHITNTVISGSNISITYPTVVGRHYTFEYSTDLAAWLPVPGITIAGTGNPITTQIGPTTGLPKYFVRVRAGP